MDSAALVIWSIPARRGVKCHHAWRRCCESCPFDVFSSGEQDLDGCDVLHYPVSICNNISPFLRLLGVSQSLYIRQIEFSCCRHRVWGGGEECGWVGINFLNTMKPGRVIGNRPWLFLCSHYFEDYPRLLALIKGFYNWLVQEPGDLSCKVLLPPVRPQVYRFRTAELWLLLHLCKTYQFESFICSFQISKNH